MDSYWYPFRCLDCCRPEVCIEIEAPALRFLSADRRVCPQCSSWRFQHLFGKVTERPSNPPEAYYDDRPIMKMTGNNFWGSPGGMYVGPGMRLDSSGTTIAGCGVGLDVHGDAKVVGSGVGIFGRTLDQGSSTS